jgi:hypothetical protein
MQRHPEWMQALEIEYDLSFFDTDPFEPQPGGCMSLWPFFIGHFIELPYTLVQDCTLVNILGETTPQLWLRKIDFLKSYYGMALVNTHPDYLDCGNLAAIYRAFLQEIKDRGDFWNALPREVARWWHLRAEISDGVQVPGITYGYVTLDGKTLQVMPTAAEGGRQALVDRVKIQELTL